MSFLYHIQEILFLFLPHYMNMQPYRNCTHIEATYFPHIHTNVPSTFTYFVLICVKKLSAAHTSLCGKFLLYFIPCLCSTFVLVNRITTMVLVWEIEPLGIFCVHTQFHHFMDVCAHTANIYWKGKNEMSWVLKNLHFFQHKGDNGNFCCFPFFVAFLSIVSFMMRAFIRKLRFWLYWYSCIFMSLEWYECYLKIYIYIGSGQSFTSDWYWIKAQQVFDMLSNFGLFLQFLWLSSSVSDRKILGRECSCWFSWLASFDENGLKQKANKLHASMKRIFSFFKILFKCQ